MDSVNPNITKGLLQTKSNLKKKKKISVFKEGHHFKYPCLRKFI